MNETLEAMARALFKSWFVDFDPVRAKAEGRDPGLPKPLADLFPASFEDSELGEIPEGVDVSAHFGDIRERDLSGGTLEHRRVLSSDAAITASAQVRGETRAEVRSVRTERTITRRRGRTVEHTAGSPACSTVIASAGQGHARPDVPA